MVSSRSGQADDAPVHDDVRLIDAHGDARPWPQPGLDVAAGGQHGVAHQDRGAAGGRLLVVGHDGGVAHDHPDGSERCAQLLSGDLREDGAGTLAHVRGTGVDDDAAVHEQADRRIGESGGGAGLDADGDAAATPGRGRRVPADELRGAADGLLPIAVGRRVEGDEGLALAGQVVQADRQAIDAQLARSPRRDSTRPPS